jgi:hypothetical protein
MKRTLLTSLSVLMPSALVTPAANAIPQVESNLQGKQYIAMSSARASDLSPNSLVSLAYRGEFRDRGIPGYGLLQPSRVTAESLVKVAIEAGRLSPEVLFDRGYLNVVEVELKDLKD